MANQVYFSPRHKAAQISDRGDRARFNDEGITEVDSGDDSLILAVEGAGAVKVDVEGTEEALTPGTVQTATTLSAIVFRNSTAETTLNIRETDATGDVVLGLLTIAANAERVIVLPEQLTADGGVFVEVVTGALTASPGFLIP